MSVSYGGCSPTVSIELVIDFFNMTITQREKMNLRPQLNVSQAQARHWFWEYIAQIFLAKYVYGTDTPHRYGNLYAWCRLRALRYRWSVRP